MKKRWTKKRWTKKRWTKKKEWIIAAIRLIFLLLGIWLVCSAEQVGLYTKEGQEWKVTLGIVMAGFSGISILFWLVALLCKHGVFGRNADSDPAASLSMESYRRLEKKTWCICIAIWIAAAALVIGWTNMLSVFLGASVAAGAWGAVRIMQENREAAKNTSIGCAVVGSILVTLLSGNLADKRYDYVVNGIRISDGAENFAGKLVLLVMSFFLLRYLIYGLSCIIFACCMVKEKS